MSCHNCVARSSLTLMPLVSKATTHIMPTGRDDHRQTRYACQVTRPAAGPGGPRTPGGRSGVSRWPFGYRHSLSLRSVVGMGDEVGHPVLVSLLGLRKFRERDIERVVDESVGCQWSAVHHAGPVSESAGRDHEQRLVRKQDSLVAGAEPARCCAVGPDRRHASKRDGDRLGRAGGPSVGEHGNRSGQAQRAATPGAGPASCAHPTAPRPPRHAGAVPGDERTYDPVTFEQRQSDGEHRPHRAARIPPQIDHPPVRGREASQRLAPGGGVRPHRPQLARAGRQHQDPVPIHQRGGGPLTRSGPRRATQWQQPAVLATGLSHHRADRGVQSSRGPHTSRGVSNRRTRRRPVHSVRVQRSTLDVVQRQRPVRREPHLLSVSCRAHGSTIAGASRWSIGQRTGEATPSPESAHSRSQFRRRIPS